MANFKGRTKGTVPFVKGHASLTTVEGRAVGVIGETALDVTIGLRALGLKNPDASKYQEVLMVDGRHIEGVRIKGGFSGRSFKQPPPVQASSNPHVPFDDDIPF